MASRLETRQGRLRAYEILALQQRCCPKFQWHIGLNSRNRVFLDFEGDHVTLSNIIDAAFLLKRRTSSPVLVFRSSKNGYHLVTVDRFSKEKWVSTYKYFLNLKHKAMVGYDRPHSEISLRYGKSTLRVSNTKPHGHRPKLMAIIN